MYGRFHHKWHPWDWEEQAQIYGPPPWACCRWGEPVPGRASIKERKAWLEFLKARLEARLEELKAEIEALGAE